MKVDMSPEAIENRLKLVGELTRACLLLGRNSLKNAKAEGKRNFAELSQTKLEK